ncbi:MAG TPA: NADPH-dependent F420 reductase [Steroidobacteraceae bacterium]|nr:NADPH-dependent F420 reductase [Steroidobacteraceae bacterium]
MSIHSTHAARFMRRVALGIVAAIALVAALASTQTARAATPASEHPMKIGIIGAGHIGGTLARLWSHAGHEVMISSRHPENLKELAQSLGPQARVGTPHEAALFGDVVVVSVPYAATPQLGKDLAKELAGKIVLDTGNPYPSRDGPMAEDARKRGTGVTSAEFLPGTRLVRAFNAINAGPLATEAHRKGEKIGIPLASNDPEALQVAEQLVRDAGFDPVVVGGLDRAREFDVGSPVYVKSLTARELRKALNLPNP